MNARETALNVLIACRREGGWSNGVLKERLARDGLDRRDAALATRLCYGVVQTRMTLDFYLKQLLTGRLKDLHPAVHDILHLGLYQLFMMDKIPESAAVNESVSLAKKYCRGQKNAPGLVNAVLRNAMRRKEELKPPATLEQKYSHPEKLIRLLKESIGPDRLEPMLKANNEMPPTVVQVNTLRAGAQKLKDRLRQEGVEAQTHPWMPQSLVLTGTGNLEALPAFREGLFYVQDTAARLSVLCADLPREGCRVLDACSAPGGKTFAAAMAMEGKGQIFSCDIYPHKAELIQKGARRLGIENLTAVTRDGTQFEPAWEKSMDAVIVDVPCSGYGIIRKKPDIRYKDPEKMADLPQLQLQILTNQARYVRPGGVLMYSTCTLLRRENEDVVEAFLKNHPEFYTEKLPLPDLFPENTTGMLTLIPGEYDTDGFFICRLRRRV